MPLCPPRHPVHFSTAVYTHAPASSQSAGFTRWFHFRCSARRPAHFSTAVYNGQLHSEWEPADGLIYSVLLDTLDHGKAWADDPTIQIQPPAQTNQANALYTASAQREH